MKLAILSSVALICIGQSFASPANNLARSSGSSSDNLRTANGSPYTPGESVPVIFSNAKRYKFDVDGNAIGLGNGIVEFIGNQYLWIAEDQGCTAPSGTFCNITTWSSPDLKSWSKNPVALFDINSPVNQAACTGGFGTCSRPKIVYNTLTKKYVFYGFSGKIGEPGIPVFTSDNLTSGYSYVGRSFQEYRPFGWASEDLGLKVIDGEGYLVFTAFDLPRTIAGDFGSIWPPFINPVWIQKLTPDYLNGTGPSYPVVQGSFPITNTTGDLLDGQFQAPDIFKRQNMWYVIGSGTCGVCNGTTTLAYRSKSLEGPWHRQIVQSDLTCGGQSMGILEIPAIGKQETQYIYHSDAVSMSPNGLRWGSAHGHDFFQLEFNSDDSIKSLSCSTKKSFTIQAPLGDASLPSTGRATSAADGSDNFGSYTSANNYPAMSFFQTWTSSKTGTLSEVGVNLAANIVNSNITMTVFRYANEQQLLQPFFQWETLARVPIGLTNITIATSFQVVRLPVNAAVKKGDRLGFVLDSARSSSLPIGYLLGDISGKKTDHKLYGLTRGHVSLGEDGKTKPIYPLANQELKWYATVD